jgi:site-specific recombinase XerD
MVRSIKRYNALLLIYRGVTLRVRSYYQILFRKGKHPKIVQSLLGHSSITQTMDRYSHLLEGIGGDAVEGLDESFG